MMRRVLFHHRGTEARRVLNKQQLVTERLLTQQVGGGCGATHPNFSVPLCLYASVVKDLG
jgi:hypothetical protein